MRLKKIVCAIVIILILILNNTPIITNFIQIPAHQIILEGEESRFNIGFPLSITVRADKQGIIKINNVAVHKERYLPSLTRFSIKSEDIGHAVVNLKLFGIIPVKNVMLDIVPKKYVIVGGQPIGVRINTKGVIVVGFSDIIGTSGKVYCPGKQAGIRIGDILLRIDGLDIKDSDSIVSILREKGGRTLSLQIQRDERIIDLKVNPIKSKDDGEYKLGLWVRDHTSGIGTLTFVDPSNNKFGALGHPITDMDTGQMLNIKDGEIMHAHITSIQQGYKSRPGEIKGIFIEGKDSIGKIEKNTKYGIYGTLYNKDNLTENLYPIGYQSQVKPGPAKILAMIDDSKVREYSIEIQKVVKQDQPNPKSMIIKITDPYLLKHTGGIIQGMSGSPIIQDGKLVGAVTHVFVNDPTRGYGIYIEWMIDELNKK
ncbi:stage IV sporulation protein B [Caldanaerobius fijiensis DSM 17918]|uniref:Stage IV sporulation protein B n=1 Tax=Caldanaerobius fijiensis DSM 17918 TaxID=1121256 RepID=A0A1M4U8T3_9THEO|nr:SpoIVB peptidase [Caldanaerobius fijiensis]SHE53135.1 stage IV sporulation protein B [Caldanaerobius fijiensis DSM 17918]